MVVAYSCSGCKPGMECGVFAPQLGGGGGGIKPTVFQAQPSFLPQYQPTKMTDNRRPSTSNKQVVDKDDLNALHAFHQLAAAQMDAAQDGQLDAELRMAAGIGSLAASALLNKGQQKAKEEEEEVIIRYEPTKPGGEEQDDDITFLDESKEPKKKKKEEVEEQKEKATVAVEDSDQLAKFKLMFKQMQEQEKAAKKAAPRRQYNKKQGSCESLQSSGSKKGGKQQLKQEQRSTSSTTVSSAPGIQKKELAKLVKDLVQKEKKCQKTPNRKRKHDEEEEDDGGDYEDDQEEEEEEEDGEMERERSPSVDSVAEQRKMERRDKYKKIGISEAVLGRAQKLKLSRNTLNMHLCESCITEQRKREDDFLLMAKYVDGIGAPSENWGQFSVLTIRCCASCLEANVQLSLLAERHWREEEEAVEKHAMRPHVKKYTDPLYTDPLHFQTGYSCATSDDKKLLRMKYCHSVIQCSDCQRLQAKMADEEFLRRGPEDTFVLHFCLCFPCVSANKEYQNLIFRHFSRFSAKK